MAKIIKLISLFSITWGSSISDNCLTLTLLTEWVEGLQTVHSSKIA